MIKYHGTPIGGTKWDALKFLNGRHALISFAHPGQTAEVLECCESFCLDNGAFTIWKSTGGMIDVEKYIEWVTELSKHPSFDFCIIPDIIGGTEEDNDSLVNSWNCRASAIPVYHLGESIDRFFRLAEKFDKVAFGSTDKWPRNGSKEWWKHMADFMDVVTDDDGYLPCKVHGLRMLDIKLFKYLPLHSGDSTNAAVNGGRQMKGTSLPAIHRWQGSERIAQRIEAFQSASRWDRGFLIEEGVLEK